jgi:rubredoxin
MAAAKKSTGKAARPAAAKKKTGMAAGRRTAGEAVTARKAAPAKKGMVGKKKPAQKKPAAKVKTKGSGMVVRYKCRLCGYIYSPLRGEPHNGIPRGMAFEDLPEDYLCPICGMEGKGRIGKWGFDEWIPTRYLCTMCNYIYDEKRGEPHRGIKPGTKFQDLPGDYVCPVCALDPKISLQFGKVQKNGFEPLDF